MTVYESKRTSLYWLHLFDLSPLCVFKCVLKLPVWKDSKVHWLHLFHFFSTVGFKKLNENKQSHTEPFFRVFSIHSHAKPYKLHLFCVFYCIFSNESVIKVKMRRYQSLIGCICLILFSVCFHICVLKVPARVDAYSHWLHLFEFSPLHNALSNEN